MRSRRLWLLGIIAAALSIVVLLMTPTLRPLARPAGPLGRDGRRSPVPTAGHRLTLLHFWATWCVPCRTELPTLAAFAQRHAGDGIRVIAVAQDPSFAKVDRFLGPAGAHFDSYLDPDGRYAASLVVRSLPCTIVLDESGTTLDRYDTTLDWNDSLFESRIVRMARR